MNTKPWYIRWGTVLLVFTIFGVALAVPEVRLLAFVVDAAIIIRDVEAT